MVFVGEGALTEPIPNMLRISQVSKLLGVDVTTIRTWEIQGKIKPIYTVGKHRRFYKQDVLDMMKNHTLSFVEIDSGEGYRVWIVRGADPDHTSKDIETYLCKAIELKLGQEHPTNSEAKAASLTTTYEYGDWRIVCKYEEPIAVLQAKIAELQEEIKRIRNKEDK